MAFCFAMSRRPGSGKSDAFFTVLAPPPAPRAAAVRRASSSPSCHVAQPKTFARSRRYRWQNGWQIGMDMPSNVLEPGWDRTDSPGLCHVEPTPSASSFPKSGCGGVCIHMHDPVTPPITTHMGRRGRACGSASSKQRGWWPEQLRKPRGPARDPARSAVPTSADAGGMPAPAGKAPILEWAIFNRGGSTRQRTRQLRAKGLLT